MASYILVLVMVPCHRMFRGLYARRFVTEQRQNNALPFFYLGPRAPPPFVPAWSPIYTKITSHVVDVTKCAGLKWTT